MNIKKDIREKLIKHLDKKLENNDPYIFNEVVNFIKKDRAEQLILHGVSNFVIQEIERRRDLILSEPDGIVREQMINNLALEL